MSDEKSDSDRASTFHGRCRAAFVGAVLGVVVISVSLLILMVSIGYFSGSFTFFVPQEKGAVGARNAFAVFVLFFMFGFIPIPAAILGAALGIWYQIRTERSEAKLRSEDKPRSCVWVVLTGVAILVVACLALALFDIVNLE